MGPTAAGKTALAIQLAQELPVSIISVDSTMVYRGMDIGSGKPSAQELSLAPHRLIDIREPNQPYSAGDFVQDAQFHIHEIIAAGRIPLLVGGTMLYFRSLLNGLASLPQANPQLRASLLKEAEAKGWPQMHADLNIIDPVSAARIHPNDPQRIQRALEVFQLSGRPLSQFDNPASPLAGYALQAFALAPAERSTLHQAIEQRFLQMLSQDLVGEVKSLCASGRLLVDLPAARAVGYRQVLEYLQGNFSKSEMIEKAVTATRQLAKRQYTWLRSWPNLHWLASNSPHDFIKNLG